MTEYLKEYLNYRSGTLQAAIPEGCKLEHIQKLQLTSPTQEISGELAIVSGTRRPGFISASGQGRRKHKISRRRVFAA